MKTLKNTRIARVSKIAAAGLAVTGLLLAAGTIEEVPADASPVEVKYAGDYLIEDAPAPQCQEDQPCWDCETMGNRICGETMGPPMETYLEAYDWCDAEYGNDSEEAIDCQIAAYKAWYPEA